MTASDFNSSASEPHSPDPPEGSASALEAEGLADRDADALMVALYTELRRLAGRHMSDEPGSHTLQPTALVHEAYLRLLGDDRTEWANRAHLFAAAAQAMRRILIERARRRRGPRRGGGWRRLDLEAGDLTFDADPSDLLALDEALRDLEAIDARAGSVVMLRFFAGLSTEQIAELLEVSERTVKREWAFARAWLHRRVAGERDDAAEVSEESGCDD